jgi:hypothetical protein
MSELAAIAANSWAVLAWAKASDPAARMNSEAANAILVGRILLSKSAWDVLLEHLPGSNVPKQSHLEIENLRAGTMATSSAKKCDRMHVFMFIKEDIANEIDAACPVLFPLCRRGSGHFTL